MEHSFLLVSVYVLEKFSFTLCVLLLFRDQEVNEMGMRSDTPGKEITLKQHHFFF